MQLNYQLEDNPPIRETLLYGLQWFAVSVAAVIIAARILGSPDGSIGSGILYHQKLFFVIGIALLVQILWGHRMPLVIGPATVLMIGILASQSSSQAAIYTSISVCGLILAFLALSGLFTRMQQFFTPRVVAVILLLVAFTLTPAIMQLILTGSELSPLPHLGFALLLILSMTLGHRHAQGLWRSLIVLLGMIIGTVAYILIDPEWIMQSGGEEFSLIGLFTDHISAGFALDSGLILAFLLCFIGLAVNDLGSIQAVGSVLNVDRLPERITHGITVTGLSNALAGIFGVIGPVNYSFSPGIIASTGCAARRCLIPAALIFILLAFSPKMLFYLTFIPPVVIGCVLLYIMASQVAAGLLIAFDSIRQSDDSSPMDQALLIGLPVLVGILVAFLPASVTGSFPDLFRPILSNGFVVGILFSLFLEHT